MIKATAKAADGTPVLLLGLTAINCQRLMAGQPITLQTGEMGLPALHVTIFAGETEDSILAAFRKHGVIIGELRDERDGNGRRRGEGQ